MRNSLLLVLALLVLVIAPLGASSVQEGPVLKGVVASAKALDARSGNWELTVTLLEEPGAPSTGKQSFHKGSVVPVTVKGENGRTFKRGDAVKLRWQWYSGMTPNGPMTALSWHLVP